MGEGDNERCIVEVGWEVQRSSDVARIMLNSEQRQAAVLVMLNLGYVTAGGMCLIT
jgi:hypothetical protein